MRTWTWILAALGVAVVVVSILGGGPSAAGDEPQGCIACHEKANPGLVEQWRQSRHAHVEPTRVGCEDCHGSEHTTAEDVAEARTPTPNTCKKCHFKQVKSFLRGKHALAEDSVQAIPMFGKQPEAVQRMACLGCHKVGQKWEDGSIGRCDSCHTRHHFSKEEARRAEACETCHMGEDHSQYEMWRSSKHGVIHHLMPDLGRAPVCSTCHMQDGDHAVMTGWGFLGLRVGIEDPAWQEDVMTIVKAIGPWGRDEEGMKQRVEAIRALKLARLDAESFNERRETMLNACEKCHTRTFGREHLENADQVIKETTRLMAEAVRVVDGLYADGILPQTADGPKHTDLLLFYESPTEIEQELYRMFLFHRQKAFQGAIHANPDYMHWFGWAPMKSSFRRIQQLAAELRAR
jgi:hypothetical protein